MLKNEYQSDKLTNGEEAKTEQRVFKTYGGAIVASTPRETLNPNEVDIRWLYSSICASVSVWFENKSLWRGG